MPIHRRDFMKLLGVSVASLYLARCQAQTAEPTPAGYDQPTCYEPPPPTDVPTPVPTVSSARQRLRLYWLRFGELAEKSQQDTENKLGSELLTGHRTVLDELVASGEISAPVADLVHEAYSAAVFHVWRSNAPMTCYLTMGPYYGPASANVLVEQTAALNQIAGQGTVDPATLAKAQSALEHDLAFYALTDEEIQTLYDQLRKDNEAQAFPSFEDLSLELTPEAQAATQFIIRLLTNT